jgi:hypothetical protein
MRTDALSHCCTTQVICQSRGSSSIVEVAASLAAFVGVLRGAGKLQGTLGPKTIANMWKVLRLIIGKPTHDWTICLPEIPETEQRNFTPTETQKLIDAAEGPVQSSIRIAICNRHAIRRDSWPSR